jgi:hypothetical protein
MVVLVGGLMNIGVSFLRILLLDEGITTRGVDPHLFALRLLYDINQLSDAYLILLE